METKGFFLIEIIINVLVSATFEYLHVCDRATAIKFLLILSARRPSLDVIICRLYTNFSIVALYLSIY